MAIRDIDSKQGFKKSLRTEDCLVGGGEMGELMRSMDWSRTRLGPIESWPQSLRTMLGVVLGSRFPMLLWWGPDLLHLYNDAYRPILRDKHPASLAAPAAEVWAEIWDVAGPLAKGVMEGGPATWTEDLQLFINSSGMAEETYFTFSYSPVPGDDGRVGGLLNTVQETTAKVQSERQIRMLHDLAARAAEAKSEEDAYRAAIEVLTSNELDLPFTLFYVLNEKADEARLIGASGWQNYHGAAKPARVAIRNETGTAMWPLSEAIKTGREVIVEDLAVRFGSLPAGRWNARPERAIVLPLARAGQSMPFAVVVAGVSPHRTLDDRYRRFFRATADQVTTVLTNARAYEEERKRAEALAEIDRAKTAFFSNVSHEFRTPLTLMLGPLEDELAENESPLPLARRARLETAHRNTLRLLKLVNTLLDFSRIEAGRIQASYTPINLSAYTAELAGVFRSAIEKGGLTLTVDCSPLPELMYVDKDMWEKIVLNLLSNAFKHTFEGGIRVTLKWCGDHAELTVADSGVGIAQAELPHLFDRFHRVKGAKSRTHEGTGIGLALVKELVHVHDGTVSVESREGYGSTFNITIKTGHAHLPADRLSVVHTQTSTATHAAAYVQEALHWPSDVKAVDTPAASSIEVVEHPMPNRASDTTNSARWRILLADDNADMREYVGRLLAERYAVVAMPDGTAALAAALANPPDLVLTDVMMPGLDGFGLLRALRADERTRTIPVILLSARAGEESAVEGLQAGADDYLAKPFSARELLARVQTHLDLSRLRGEWAAELELQVQERTAELKQAEKKLRETQQTAMQQERLRALGQMASGIAHDINNALSPVSLYTQSLLEQESNLSERARGYLETMQRAIDDVAETIGRMREFYRKRETQLTLAPVDVNTLVQQVVDLTRARWSDIPQQRGIVVEMLTDLMPEPPPIMGVASEIRDALTNLIFNAVDAMPNGGTLTLRTRVVTDTPGSQSRHMDVEVSDTGAGMDEETRQRCLEPFFTTKGERGTGLGLAMVYGMVQRHRAQVKIESTVGKGTTVRLSFALPVTAADIAHAQSPMAEAAPSGLRILVIDDDPSLLISLRNILESDGHEVVTAASGQTGIDVFRRAQRNRKPFAVGITDLGMPHIDGSQVASAVKAAAPSTQVILLTGWGQRLSVEGNVPPQVDYVLNKPPKLRELRDALARCSEATPALKRQQSSSQ